MTDDEWYRDDSEPVPFGAVCESVSSEWFLCCLERGHEGLHEAQTPLRSRITGKFQVVATW